MTEIQISTDIKNLTLATVVREETGYDEDGHPSPPVTLGDAIVAQLARQAARQEGFHGEIRERVTRIREEVIREQVIPLITEAISGTITRTNSYGEPSGGTTTLREIIVSEVKRLVTQPSPNSPHSARRTLLGQLVHDEVNTAFRKEVAAEVARAKEAVATEIGDLLKEAVKTAMRSR